MTPMERMSEVWNTFTKSEKQIYSYITQNSQEVLKSNLIVLAQACGVSKTALMRFSQKLGYSGFTEFKYDFSRYVHSGAKGQRIKSGNREDTAGYKIIEAYLYTLREMEHCISEAETAEIAKRLMVSERVKIFALNRDAYTAQHMRHHFYKINFDAEAVFDPVLVEELSQVGTPKDAHIFLTVTGNTPGLREAIEVSRSSGVYTLLVTSTKNSPMQKYAEKTVYIPSTNQFTDDFFLDQHANYLVWIEVLVSYLGSALSGS